jgi:hypothetical protein
MQFLCVFKRRLYHDLRFVQVCCPDISVQVITQHADPNRRAVYARICDSSLAAIAVSNPSRCMEVCVLCVLSDRGLCDGPIARPEESCRVWCVWVWSWSLDDEDVVTHYGLLCHKNTQCTTVLVRSHLSPSMTAWWQKHIGDVVVVLVSFSRGYTNVLFLYFADCEGIVAEVTFRRHMKMKMYLNKSTVLFI